MDELTFRAIYVAVGAGVIGLLLFLFGRKLDRKIYLVPAIVGFLFGIVTSLFVGGGIVSFLFGGLLTGYLIKESFKFTLLFRAGALNGTLAMTALFVPGTIFFIGGGTYGLFTSKLSDILAAISALGKAVTAEDLLYFLLSNMVTSILIVIAFSGLGAIMGGYLRRVLKPRVEKVEEPKKIQ